MKCIIASNTEYVGHLKSELLSAQQDLSNEMSEYDKFKEREGPVLSDKERKSLVEEKSRLNLLMDSDKYSQEQKDVFSKERISIQNELSANMMRDIRNAEYITDIKKAKNKIVSKEKLVEKWGLEVKTNRRIVAGNIRKAIASGFTKEDIRLAIAKPSKGYMKPSDELLNEVDYLIAEERDKYPTYGKEYPWTSISPDIRERLKREVMSKQDDDLTEEDYEAYVEIYETPTVIREGEEIAESKTDESVQEMEEPLEKATDSKLNRREEFVIEDTGYEPLAGTWKKVFVGGEPTWINERGEQKYFSDFKGVNIKKQDRIPESQKESHSKQPTAQDLAQGITHLEMQEPPRRTPKTGFGMETVNS